MVVYYIEVNAICMIILLLFAFQIKIAKTASTGLKVLNLLLYATILFCLSDMLAGVFRGKMFPGAKAIIEISNLAYYELLVVISFLWNTYARMRLNVAYLFQKKHLIYSALPMLLFTALALTNPFTHWLFRINAQNLYERNAGVYLHWLVVWGYFLWPTVHALRRYLREKSVLKKQEILPILYFAAMPFAASLLQMCMYGVTTTQAGITISLAMICITRQEAQILTDSLTGINNRRGLDNYIANSMQHNEHTVYTLLMIDVDDFKQINDQYGHMTGDLVLQSIAKTLKHVCRLVTGRLYLCRFGGDEFIIIGANCRQSEIQRLKDALQESVQLDAKQGNLPVSVTISLGEGVGRCRTEKDWKDLMAQADKAMYATKTEKKQRQAGVG